MGAVENPSKNKMVLSRPLANWARNFSTSTIRRSADGAHGTKQWKLGTYLVAFPVVILATLYNFAMEHEHPHRPEFAKYEYMRVRNKGFPWGDGQHSCFTTQLKMLCLTATKRKMPTKVPWKSTDFSSGNKLYISVGEPKV